MSVVLLKGCRTESNNTSPNQSEMQHALKHAYNQNAIVNLEPSCRQLNYLAILPFDYIFCTIPSAHKIRWQTILYSCERSLPFPFICLRSHFHWNFALDPVPTKRICLQSHAALALILCFYNFILLYKITHLFAFLHTDVFVPPKIFLNWIWLEIDIEVIMKIVGVLLA